MQEMVYQNKRSRPAILLDKKECYGYEYIILSLGTHPCAYISLDKDNMFFGKHYDDIDIDCHGGLTYSEPNLSFGEYSEKYKCIVKTSIKDKWIIGWDYAHYGDRFGNDTGTTWTTQEIKLECQLVINQLMTHSIKQMKKQIAQKIIKYIEEELLIYEDVCQITNKEELYEIMVKYTKYDDPQIQAIHKKIIDEYGEEMIDEINDYIGLELQGYYGDPAFSSASDYWNYRLG